MGLAIKQWVGQQAKSKSQKAGNHPYDVQTVQKLLAAAAKKLTNPALEPKGTDGRITPATVAAITAFQRDVVKAKTLDGRIDANGRAWKALLKAAGEVDTDPDGWPAKPPFPQLGKPARAATFGDFEYEVATGSSDPDAIKIKGGWEQNHIVTVTIPQLARIAHPKSIHQRFHKLASMQFLNLWQAWEDHGLLDRVLTYDGSFVPRFQRKTARIPGVSPLSNHSWGTAFDINAGYNPLGSEPAIMWEKGCVFELVALAYELGFFWGGHFGGGRTDGMHFEIAKIV
jgi:hypothetical protein